MKKHRTAISLALSASILASTIVFGSIYADEEVEFEESFDFSALSAADPSVSADDYDIVAFIETDYPTINLAELSELDKDARRARVGEYYRSRNEALAPELEEGRVSCSYVAPYIEIDYDSVEDYGTERSELIEYASGAGIRSVKVDIAPTNIMTEESTASDSTVEYTLAQVYSDVGITDRTTYTGTGIKVGILEGDRPSNLTNFPTNSVISYGSSYSAVHASEVMSIIGGTYGIAPDVSFRCAAYNYNPNPNTNNVSFVDCLNWLMITQSVDVINMSATMLTFEDYWLTPVGPYVVKKESSTMSHYTNVCAYIDNAIATTGCLLIISAGNTSDSEYVGESYYQMIIKPGLSIDALTVGSVNNKNRISDFSSFMEYEDDIYKPEVTAPGEDIVIPNFGKVSGTSFSAPVVTGIAVKLMQEFPGLKNNVTLLKNIIMGGCTQCAGQKSGFSDQTGFGRVNYTASRELMLGGRAGSAAVDSTANLGDTLYRERFTLPAGSKGEVRLSRAVLGINSDGYTNFSEAQGSIIMEPAMNEYSVRITEVETGAVKQGGAAWNGSLADFYVTNKTDSTKTYEITVISNEATECRDEGIAVSHNGTHVHTYCNSCSPSNPYYHTLYCNCGASVTESHTYENSVCTVCRRPENF